MKNLVFDLYTAQQMILDRCQPLDTEKISLDKASGRILATDVKAKYNVPLFDKSPLDGYAFRAEDTEMSEEEESVTLPVTGEIPAGSCAGKPLKKGCAVKILTGAPIPEGADAVAKFEETTAEPGYVMLHRTYHSGDNIVRKGEDVKEDERIADCGEIIDAAVHGMLASQGIDEVEVYKTPLIGIISQGNELLNPGEPLQGGKIYNSNRYMLGTALKLRHFSSIYLGDVQDDEMKIAEVLKNAVSMYDVVIMTGGVSVGTYDYTKSALERAGAEVLVDKIKMKPGSSCCLAILDGVPVFGLSGNPAAAMTTFHLVAMPVIQKMAGNKDFLPDKITVELDSDFSKKSPNMRILKGKLDLTDGTVRMKLNENQANGSVSAMSGAEVFAIVPAGSGPLKKGSLLDAYLL